MSVLVYVSMLGDYCLQASCDVIILVHTYLTLRFKVSSERLSAFNKRVRKQTLHNKGKGKNYFCVDTIIVCYFIFLFVPCYLFVKQLVKFVLPC